MYINVNGIYKNAENRVNVNGFWKTADPYINVNGFWKRDRADFPKLSFTSVIHDSAYGGNYIRDNGIEISSSHYGTGDCAMRSKETLSLKKGDKIVCNIGHIRRGSSYGQTGRVYLSTATSHSSSQSSRTIIYLDEPKEAGSPGFQRELTVTSNLEGVYLWCSLEGRSNEDTHIFLTAVTINGQKVV